MSSKGTEGPVGDGVVIRSVGPSAVFKVYAADRPAPGRLRAAETVLEVSITLDHSVQNVWPVFKDFNLWMSRFGYSWDGAPADNENKFVSLGNKPGNDQKYGQDGTRNRYIVRKVIPERLIHFDSMPFPIPGKDCAFTGHNIVTMYEERGQTKIVFFMEHTWYSETLSISELRAEAKGSTDSGEAFWRDYFLPDLFAAIEADRNGAS